MPACWGCCCPSKHTWRACAYRRSRCVNWTSITVPIKNVSTVEREPRSEGRWLYCASVCQSHPVLFHPAQRPQSRKLSGTITGGDNHSMELLTLQLWRERSLVGLSRGREGGGWRLPLDWFLAFPSDDHHSVTESAGTCLAQSKSIRKVERRNAGGGGRKRNGTHQTNV